MPTITNHSMLTCPHCGHVSQETMPMDACQFFHTCENCKVLLRPRANDCCVFCSYGSTCCPPMQLVRQQPALSDHRHDMYPVIRACPPPLSNEVK